MEIGLLFGKAPLSIWLNINRFMHSILLIIILILSDNIFAEDMQIHKKELSLFVQGSWTVVLIPDTQNYLIGKKQTKTYIVDNIMDWIVAEKNRRNIKMVLHLGDMTFNNNEKEWKLIRSSYKKLDNILPYMVCEGNHDLYYGKNRMNDYFKIDDNPFNKTIFGASYEEGKLENSYYLMKQNDMKYLFLTLGWNADDFVMKWADNVIKSHPNHRIFITVHTYISEESRILSTDGRPALYVNDRLNIFKKLAQPNENVEFITCGHVGPRKRGTGKGPTKYKGILEYEVELATAHRSDKKNGATLHQVLLNAQSAQNGGDGWILLLEFSPDNKNVKVKTYSPHLNQWRTGAEYEYILQRD